MACPIRCPSVAAKIAAGDQVAPTIKACIAALLNIKETTVKVHRRHIYAKIGVASQTELFARFILSLPLGDVAVDLAPTKLKRVQLEA